MANITMSLDDTLELDTIIEESSRASNPVSSVKYEGSNSTVHNLTGFQTHTSVFDPEESGNYTITVNGQTLLIRVTDPSIIPNKEIDHFEDGDISEYSGNGGSFNVQNTTVKKGTYAVKGSMGGGLAVSIGSTSGLPYYPQRGDQIGFWTRFSGDQPNIGFRWAATNGKNDSYNIDYRDSEGSWRLRSRTNDNPINLDTLSDDPASNGWYYVFIEEYKNDGSISISIYDDNPADNANKVGTLSANNSDHSTGGIYLSVNDSSGGSTTGYFDHISYK